MSQSQIPPDEFKLAATKVKSKQCQASFARSESNNDSVVEEAWSQSKLLDHIQTKKPVTRALANAVCQEVWDFIAIAMLHNSNVVIPRLGEFSRDGDTVNFRPSNHLLTMMRAQSQHGRPSHYPAHYQGKNPQSLRADGPMDKTFEGGEGANLG